MLTGECFFLMVLCCECISHCLFGLTAQRQFVYGEDGMDGAFIERQSIKTFGLNDTDFEHRYRVDVTDPSGGFLPSVLQVGIDDSSLELQRRLDE